MRLIIGHEDVFGRWAALKIPHLVLDQLGAFRTFGIVDSQGVIRGVALYHGYAPHYRGIEISFALESPRYLSKSVIAGIMAYPFQQLHCGRVTAATPRKSASARRFLEDFGFRREGVARFGFGNFGDAVIYGLTEKDWRESPFNAAGRLDEQEVGPDAAAGSRPHRRRERAKRG